MQSSRIALGLAGFFLGGLAAGCNLIAGIHEGFLGAEGSVDASDGSAPPFDAPAEAPIDAPVEAELDAFVDAGGDASADAESDAPADAGFDAPSDGSTAFTFVDSIPDDAGVSQRIGGLAVYGKVLYFSASAASGRASTSILRCPADAPGVCTAPETVAQGIAGGAGSISVDDSSGSLAGTTGVPDDTGGVAFLVTGLAGGGTPAVTTEGIAGQNMNYFTAAVANASAVAWIDLDRLGVDVQFAGMMGGATFYTPTYSTSPDQPTALLSMPAHSSLFFAISTSHGGQIWVCPLPGCGASPPAELINGNSVFGSPNAMATDGTSIYFTASGIGGAAGGVYAFNRTTQNLTKLASAQNPKEVALDSSGRVFWIDAASTSRTIEWCATTGCPAPPAPPHSLPISAAPSSADTSALVADDTSLYWNATTPAGAWSIRRIALP
jgi:hypothetical protein